MENKEFISPRKSTSKNINRKQMAQLSQMQEIHEKEESPPKSTSKKVIQKQMSSTNQQSQFRITNKKVNTLSQNKDSNIFSAPKQDDFDQVQHQFQSTSNLSSTKGSFLGNSQKGADLVMNKLKSELSQLKDLNKEQEIKILDQKKRIDSFKVIEEEWQKLKKRKDLASPFKQQMIQDQLIEDHTKQLRQQQQMLEQQHKVKMAQIQQEFMQQLQFEQKQLKNCQQQLSEQWDASHILKEQLQKQQILNDKISAQVTQLDNKVSSKDQTINQKNREIEQLKELNKNLTKQWKNLEITNISSDSKNEQIVDYLRHYNPDIDINPQQIQFAKLLAENTRNPITPAQIKQMKNKSKSIIEKYQNKSKFNNGHDKDNKSQNLKMMMLLQKIASAQGIDMHLTDEQEQQQRSKKSLMQYDLIATGNFNAAQYYSLQYQKAEKPISPKEIQDELPTLKQHIAECCGIPNAQKNIVVMNIQTEEINPQIQFIVKDNILKSSNSKLPKGMSIQVQSLLQNSLLSPDMFDPRYDQEWSSISEDSDTRGALVINDIEVPQLYYYPKGFQGYGLRVFDKYGEDKEWLSMSNTSKTWIVLFHGTQGSVAANIIVEGLKTGTNNAYEGDICRITQTQIKLGPSNCYLSDKIDVAKSYAKEAIELNGKNYHVVFQCRVNPKGVKSPLLEPNYYTVENSLVDIRPYRILLREFDS